ncbi:MAG: T9SS type A sorting domain-containing protein [Gemmatimonadetes bacterium]|nr:T9SS type A sorting domain-containing protein [Gemmatimonadota bacterium]
MSRSHALRTLIPAFLALCLFTVDAAASTAIRGECLATRGIAAGPAGRELVSVNPATGVATVIGSHFVNDVPGLAINATGSIYGGGGATQGGDSLYSIDRSTGLATPIGDMGFHYLRALAFNDLDALYAIGGLGADTLFFVDTATAVATPIIPVTGAELDGMAFDPSDGTLYGVGSWSNLDDTLYQISFGSGVASAVGSFGLGAEVGDIYFDGAGNLFGTVGGGAANDFVSVNKTTGAATVIGATGSSALTGLSYFPEIAPGVDGIAYATTGVNDGGRLLRINTQNGSATLIGMLPGVDLMSAVAIRSDGSMFGSEGFSGNFYHVSSDGGGAEHIGTPGIEYRGLAFDENDNLFGVDVLNHLFRVDVSNGSGQLIDTVSVLGLSGLAFDPITGALFACSINPGILYTIDTTDADTDQIGPIGHIRMTDLFFDSAGDLFATNGGGQSVNELLSIDRTTGAGTVIGPTGFIAVSGLTHMLSATPTGTPGNAPAPAANALLSNAPNPFNPTTQIRFVMKEAGQVRIDLFNPQGRHVGTVLNEVRDPGAHALPFDAGDLASGTYFYRMQAGGLTAVQKMTLIR